MKPKTKTQFHQIFIDILYHNFSLLLSLFKWRVNASFLKILKKIVGNQKKIKFLIFDNSKYFQNYFYLLKYIFKDLFYEIYF